MGFALLGRDPVTVPYLDEAFHFVPFGIVVKKTKKVREEGGFTRGRTPSWSHVVIKAIFINCFLFLI